MGAVYSTHAIMKVKDEAKAVCAFRNFVIMDAPNLLGKHGIPETFDDCMNILFAAHQNGIEKKSDTEWVSGFDATYSWWRFMVDAFESIGPFLDDGSRLHINDFNEEAYYGIKNGELVYEEVIINPDDI